MINDPISKFGVAEKAGIVIVFQGRSRNPFQFEEIYSCASVDLAGIIPFQMDVDNKS